MGSRLYLRKIGVMGFIKLDLASVSKYCTGEGNDLVFQVDLNSHKYQRVYMEVVYSCGT